MTKKILQLFLIVILLMCTSKSVHAQGVKDTIPADSGTTMHHIEIIYADKQGFKKLDSTNSIQILAGKVQVKEDATIFYCDSAVLNKNLKTLEAFGNVHINDADSVHTYAQYLLYHSDTKKAELRKKVKLTDGVSTLTSEEVNYDMNQKIGEYFNGGKVIAGKSVLTSKEATYYADLKDVYFKREVVLKDPQYKLYADSLLYNTESGIATFISKTLIEDSLHRKIRTKEGFYDQKNKKAFFAKRPVIEDGKVTVIANEIETDDNTGNNILKGNAVYKDDAQDITVIANRIESNKDKETFLATQHPLMILKQEKDSIFITADSLFSGKLSQLFPVKDSTPVVKKNIKGKPVLTPKEKKSTDSTDRFFQAYRHVRIFSDSLQAVSDSLFYSSKDSVFRLFNDPIVWSDENQITGDTIYLYTKNKKADKLFVNENALLVNKAADKMFNQIKGNRITGLFTEGAIEKMTAKGNAESIYYMQDDKDSSFIGMNKASGDMIEMRFQHKALQRVVFISEVKGTIHPIKQIPDTEKELKGFQWQIHRRPKNKFELIGE